MSSIFSECYNLTEINITNFSSDNLKVYKFSFSNLTSDIDGKIYYNSNIFQIDIFNNTLPNGWKFIDKK